MGPVLEGLGKKAGPLVFEFAASPAEWVATQESRIRLIERLGDFLSSLPAIDRDAAPAAFYAVEIRTPQIYTPRLVAALSAAGARLTIGLHPSMPDASRQANALRAMDDPEGDPARLRLKGPLVVRWTLGMGDRFDDARRRYEPFSRIQRPDPVTREVVASLVLAAVRSGVPSYVVANNKAEGCAPLSMAALAERVADRLSAERDRMAADRLMPGH